MSEAIVSHDRLNKGLSQSSETKNPTNKDRVIIPSMKTLHDEQHTRQLLKQVFELAARRIEDLHELVKYQQGPTIHGSNLTRLKEKLCEQLSSRIYPCRNCFSCKAIEEAVKREKTQK